MNKIKKKAHASECIEPKIVSWWVFDPTASIFKRPANEKTTCESVTCRLKHCPLREKGFCTWMPFLGWHACPYGKMHKETGPTKRAQSFRRWVAERKSKHPDVGVLKSPPNKMAFIGDYVFLPYAHMDMNKDAAFLKHSSAFVKGTAFLPLEHWNIDTILNIIVYRPHALMGGEITTYQKESVPAFIAHLKELDPEMFDKLVEKRPDLDVEISYVGRKALLRTLAHPIEWDAKVNDKYPVHWKWDGKTLKSTSQHVYSSTWGGSIPMESIDFRAVPKENAAIVIQDSDWVTEETEFID